MPEPPESKLDAGTTVRGGVFFDPHCLGWSKVDSRGCSEVSVYDFLVVRDRHGIHLGLHSPPLLGDEVPF